MIGWLIARLRCVYRGHETVTHFDRRRLSLRCLACGHESAGWSLDDLRPPIRSRD